MDSLRAQNPTGKTSLVHNFMNTTLRELMSLLNAESGSFFLFDTERKELTLNSYFNSRQISVKDIKRKVGEGISGKVAQNKAPVLVRDIDTDPRFMRNGFNHYNTKSFISIPLFGTDKLIGLINLADKSDGRVFSEKDLQFAVTLCKYACLVLENMLDSNCFVEAKEKLNSQKALVEKYATVGKLAAGVVHEINNPLDGIIRYTNILMSQIEENSTAKEYILEIKKGLSRIANITKSLLEFSHIINSDAPTRIKKAVSICEMVDESLDVLKGRIDNKIKVVKKFTLTNLPVADMGISYVIINIIKNAVDAMPSGGTLEISTEMVNSSISLSFKDSGSGIPFEIKERIFEPFFTTKSIDKGTGLGLAIAREIIQKYEGKIEVESIPGYGTTFTVLIPKKHLENGTQLQ